MLTFVNKLFCRCVSILILIEKILVVQACKILKKFELFEFCLLTVAVSVIETHISLDVLLKIKFTADTNISNDSK